MFFLRLSCFFGPTDVGNLISGSSAFSKTSLSIWKFTVYILLKPGLENFEHHFASVWEMCNCVVVGAFFGFAFLWDIIKTDIFPSCGHCWVFQICRYIEWTTSTTSSFRIWNSLTGSPSPPLALFAVMLPKAQLTLISRMSGWLALGEWSHHCDYLGHEVLLCILAISS